MKQSSRDYQEGADQSGGIDLIVLTGRYKRDDRWQIVSQALDDKHCKFKV